MPGPKCGCGGAWLSEAMLVQLAQRAQGALVALPWQPRGTGSRSCPQCSAAMERVKLADVELDRCTPHGIWFDANELQAVLQRAPQWSGSAAALAAPVAANDDSSSAVGGVLLTIFSLVLDCLPD